MDGEVDGANPPRADREPEKEESTVSLESQSGYDSRPPSFVLANNPDTELSSRSSLQSSKLLRTQNTKSSGQDRRTDSRRDSSTRSQPLYRDSQGYLRLLMREGATKELYEYAVHMARRLIGKRKLQEHYIMNRKSEKWFKVNPTQNESVVGRELAVLWHLKTVCTSTEPSIAEQHVADQKRLLEMAKGLQSHETYEKVKVAAEAGKSIVSVLESGIWDFLVENHYITPVRNTDLWVSVRSKTMSTQRASLLEAFNEAEIAHFVPEHGHSASTNVTEALNSVGDIRSFTTLCRDKIEQWRSYEQRQYKASDRRSETLSLMEGLFDELVKRDSSINAKDLLKEAKRMELLETSVNLTAYFRNYTQHSLAIDRDPSYQKELRDEYVDDILNAIKLLEEACEKEEIASQAIWDEYVAACVDAIKPKQNEDHNPKRLSDASLSRAIATLAASHEIHTRNLAAGQRLSSKESERLFTDRQMLYKMIQTARRSSAGTASHSAGVVQSSAGTASHSAGVTSETDSDEEDKYHDCDSVISLCHDEKLPEDDDEDGPTGAPPGGGSSSNQQQDSRTKESRHNSTKDDTNSTNGRGGPNYEAGENTRAASKHEAIKGLSLPFRNKAVKGMDKHNQMSQAVAGEGNPCTPSYRVESKLKLGYAKKALRQSIAGGSGKALEVDAKLSEWISVLKEIRKLVLSDNNKTLALELAAAMYHTEATLKVIMKELEELNAFEDSPITQKDVRRKDWKKLTIGMLHTMEKQIAALEELAATQRKMVKSQTYRSKDLPHKLEKLRELLPKVEKMGEFAGKAADLPPGLAPRITEVATAAAYADFGKRSNIKNLQLPDTADGGSLTPVF